MRISLQNIGRRFNRDWIFRGIDFDFEQGHSYAILGPNGSGKSTLVQVIAGSLSPSEGSINHSNKGKNIPAEEIFQHLSFASPYLELVQDFSLDETIDFHFKFKKLLPGFNKQKVVELLGFEKYLHRQIKNYSSGMKQRVKLALAFCSDTPLLLLDEPTANLDTQGSEWYLDLIQQFSKDRLTIICSNQLHEYEFCEERLNVVDYK
ncbi:ABC transporter ATP-binding protein [Solitalea canadensis]|uniref:ABC-type multidrug transport system, ATPase component n=1 Tax=Solitalea canadensis (strain ATCC 29591 / DSM 3403 / JCM 21819 / LMG 8368 / NBRC 15130 / NCIMB 12057 / USAM 9D) TaxID=929556 RepID=H8KMZ4_SOLCM|nr:ABC transporter ATP-binding protein [Solitalea canadensis]AFD09073.1 ABC-type multidrug transport system, ATPase component [Solitalea canadensis DSM 3403]